MRNPGKACGKGTTTKMNICPLRRGVVPCKCKAANGGELGSFVLAFFPVPIWLSGYLLISSSNQL